MYRLNSPAVNHSTPAHTMPAARTVTGKNARHQCPLTCPLRPWPSVNTPGEQGHRVVPRRDPPGRGGGAVAPAPRALQGYEAMPRRRNGRRAGVPQGAGLAPNRGINQLCGLAAYRARGCLSSRSHEVLQHNQCNRHIIEILRQPLENGMTDAVNITIIQYSAHHRLYGSGSDSYAA